jgi:hypothetical protein
MIRLEERLIWPSVFLLLLMAGFVIERLHQNTFFTRLRRIVVYIIVVVSFIIQPIRTLYDRVLAYPAGPVASSHNMQINLLKRYIQNGDSIASYGGFGATHRLSFFLRARYYGMTVNTEDLYKYKIQHFFVWSNDPAAQELPLPGYRNYLHLPAMNLTIYGFIDDKDSLDPVR